MAVIRNNVTTSDGYTQALTIVYGDCMRLNLEVNNASVIFQLGTGEGGGVSWGDETFVRAGDFRSYDRAFNGVRVRSATKGKPAQITLSALNRIDIDGDN